MKTFPVKSSLLALLASSVVTLPAAAQNVDARTQVVVASFNKSKHTVKEKHGVRREKYKEIHSAPAIKSNPAEYTGMYKVDGSGFVLDLVVDSKGNVTGTGLEPMEFGEGILHKFTLKNARVSGALLTAIKVYADGRTEKLEGAFINRTEFDSPNDKGTTTFGLGVLTPGLNIEGMEMDKIFYQRR